MSNDETPEQRYVREQLYEACPVLPEHACPIKLKIQTKIGRTSWLEINPDQLADIEKILLEDK